MNLIEKFEKMVNDKGLSEKDKLEFDSFAKAYFKGKDDALQQLRILLAGTKTYDADELAKLQDEWVLKGFEHGKHVVLNNLKIYLNETSGKSL